MNSSFATAIVFNCETDEVADAFPKVRINAEVAIDRGGIHHINTDEITACVTYTGGAR
jgi:hypothetical protein